MKIELIRIKGKWREIADACNTTIGKESGTREPSSRWKRRLLLGEHSPIRQLMIKAKWYDLPYWVSVHLVRHWLGIVHWIKSQRPDRTSKEKTNRNDAPQNTPINHEIEVNAQAMINISRKRLCNCAMSETRDAWKMVLDSIKDVEPELYSVCVPECIYRGFCPEFYSCGYHKTKDFKLKLEEYRKDINS